MSIQVSRPRVSQIQVSTYDRPLHPELFGVLEQGILRGLRMDLRMVIEAGGHILLLTAGNETVTEVVSGEFQGLPTRGRQVQAALRHGPAAAQQFDGPVHYLFNGGIETLSAEEFTARHLDLQAQAAQAALVWTGAPGNRLEAAPISLLKVISTADQVEVQAYHTFPQDFAIVSTRSTFQV